MPSPFPLVSGATVLEMICCPSMYKRLYLPARGMGGGTWLLTSSILDPTIDLRVDLLDKTA